jgi:hypothetical protein
VLYECKLVVFALVVALYALLGLLSPVDYDLVLFHDRFELLFLVAHDIHTIVDQTPVPPMILEDLLDDPLVIRIKRLELGLSLMLALNERLRVIDQVDIEDVEGVEVVQVEV